MKLAQLDIQSPSNVFTQWYDLPTSLLSRFIMFTIFIAGFIFFLRLIASGFTFLTANGEPGKIQSATKGLTTGIVGLVIVIAGYFISQIIESVFGLNIL